MEFTAISLFADEASGSSESWAYSIGIPYTYTIELPDFLTFVVSADTIEPTANEWIQGFIAYFKHIETEDSDLYGQLVTNITENLPTTPQPTVALKLNSNFENVGTRVINSICSLEIYFCYFVIWILLVFT